MVLKFINFFLLTNPETPLYIFLLMTIDYTKLPPFESAGQRMPDYVHQYKCEEASMKAFKLRLEGLTVIEIAEEMGVARRTAYLYLKIAKRDIKSGKLTSVQIRELGQLSDPINLQRKRLTRRLRKTDEVIGQALEDYKNEPQNATRTALTVNKGLGVLKEETLSKSVTFEEKRLIISAQLGLAEQYGAKIPEEIKADIVEVEDKEP